MSGIVSPGGTDGYRLRRIHLRSVRGPLGLHFPAFSAIMGECLVLKKDRWSPPRCSPRLPNGPFSHSRRPGGSGCSLGGGRVHGTTGASASPGAHAGVLSRRCPRAAADLGRQAGGGPGSFAVRPGHGRWHGGAGRAGGEHAGGGRGPGVSRVHLCGAQQGCLLVLLRRCRGAWRLPLCRHVHPLAVAGGGLSRQVPRDRGRQAGRPAALGRRHVRGSRLSGPHVHGLDALSALYQAASNVPRDLRLSRLLRRAPDLPRPAVVCPRPPDGHRPTRGRRQGAEPSRAIRS